MRVLTSWKYQDVVSSAAAVAQLLAQVIELWRQVDAARESVKTAPKVFADTKEQASNLFEIIQDVKRRRELHTPAIHARVKRVETVAVGLHKILEAMALRQGRSTLRQGLFALGRGAKEDAKLADVMKRLEVAKSDLTIQIGITHIAISGEMRDDLGRLTQGAEDLVEAVNQRPEKINHRMLLESNEAWEKANQINGIIGIEESKASTTAKIMENKARGNSQQKNLILSGPELLKLLSI